MNTVRDLKLLPIWVNPQHLVATALHVMSGHGVKSIGVVEAGRLVGVIGLEDVVAAPEGARVSDVMRPTPAVIQSETQVRQVAQKFVDDGLDTAPVVDRETFQGMLTPVMLLRELGRSYDPLTNLSWSDQLREWGIDHLKNNEEVTIIFVDLNHFGIYNKKYGHIIGDRVIAKVASYLSNQIDPELDLLVRYGGDEFAIGTLRDREETEALAGLLTKRFDGRMEGADEPVTFSTGVFGGRRHKERESTHYAATIDNLINIASRNCTANKKRERGESGEGEKPAIDLKVLGIFADQDQEEGIVTVVLSAGGTVYSGADAQLGQTVVSAIANATARALERAARGVRLHVLAIDLLQEGEAQVVSVTGIVRSGERDTPVSAARRVSGDLAAVVVETTLDAFRTHI